ncbi:unnamed protein product, partial [Rotaria magnacalcarata]
MDMNEINEDDKTLLRSNRPSTLSLEIHTMDVDINEKVLVIDLCTPNDVDIKNEASTLTPKPLIERFPNLGNRLPVLPCYPTNDKYAHGDPLLPNIS